MKKLFFLTFFSFCAFSLLLAQERVVTGVITGDDVNEPLPGVNVIVMGTSIGAVSDANGNYTISVPADRNQLQFSYIGYISEVVNIGDRATIDMNLIPDIASLEEIIVVGYGAMRKSDITGAITSVRQDEILSVKSGNVLEAIQGKVPGADITRSDGRSGSGVSMLIRGERSLSASNAPLVILDGIPYGSTIDVNPEDIESIEILKDASSTAIYGSRGANGVILITTKRGKKDELQIFFNSYYGAAEAYQKIPVFDAEGYIQAKIDAHKNINAWDIDPIIENVFPGDELRGYQAFIDNGTETDWQDVVTRRGIQQDYHLGLNSGGEKYSYSLSLNYFNEKGVVVSDEFKRYTFRLNADNKVNDILTVGTSSVFTFRERDGEGPRFTDAIRLSPIVASHDSLGNYIYQPNFANPRKNPLAQAQNQVQQTTTRLFSNIFAVLNFNDHLTFRTNLSADLTTRRNGFMNPQYVPTEGFPVSGVDNRFNRSLLWNNIITYSNVFGQHELTFTGVYEVQHNVTENYTMRGQEQDFERNLWYNLSTNREQVTASNRVESAMVSFVGRVNYIFNRKYILNISGRYDGASQLAPDNKWSFFPSASAAWRISQEDFFSPTAFVSDLRLRFGYGVTGNFSVLPYSTAAALNPFPYFYEFGEPGSERAAFTYRPEILSSLDLTWERTSQYNIGVDFGLFANRIYANIDLYHSNTNDLLLTDLLPISSGYNSIITNAGKTQTQGVELGLRTINISKSDFTWSTDINFTASREEILELASGLDRDIGNLWFVGQPVSVYYEFEKIGIWQLNEEEEAAKLSQMPGDVKIRTASDTTISFDDRKIYNRRPKWYGSITNTVNFKGLDLTFNIYARWGHWISSGAFGFDPRMYDNQLAVDYWTPDNPTNEYPRLNSDQASVDFNSSLMLRDGSFIKVQFITLGYTLPQEWISPARLSQARVYASARNPLILYSNLPDGMDPERGGGFSWPLARLVVFGVNLQF